MLPFVLLQKTRGTEEMYNEKEFEEKVRRITTEVADMLIEKNKSYGNSALDPIRIFSKADTLEQLYVRIDDKLSRIKCGNSNINEDTVKDLIGYLIIVKIKQEEK